MPALASRVDRNAAAFAQNREAHEALIAELRSREAKVRATSDRMGDKFHARGQLLPRERLALLVDADAPFLELSTLASWKMHDDDGASNATGGSVITGIGFVSGVRCVICVNDAAIKGGAVSPMGLKKTLRAQDIALENKLPMVSLVESAGANLNYQAELFVDGGRVFHQMARLSAAGVAQVMVVHGSSTAGGAYLPGLCDYVVMVRGKAKVFLAGPPLVRAATGEVATDEDLGGAEMHATVTGSAEYLADDDAHGIAIARDIMRHIHAPAQGLRASAKAPRFSLDDILGIVPTDYRRPYDVREVIACLVDDSDFLEFKRGFGPQTICGHAHVDGYRCAIIGNNGPIYPAGAAKAAHFMQLCNQSGTPLVFLQNTTGYMVGTKAERDGIIKQGAKMIQAVSNSTVPRFTFLIGASFGAGNYGMSGRAYDPRFVFAWPNSRIAVMGGEQAARVLAMITEEKLKKQGTTPDPDAQAQMMNAVRARIDEESTAWFASARLWDDGIIDPRYTRKVLAFLLETCAQDGSRPLRPTTFGVARA